MQQEEFVKCIQESGIVKDHGTILRLFDALTVGQSAFFLLSGSLSNFCFPLRPLPPLTHNLFQANTGFSSGLNNYLTASPSRGRSALQRLLFHLLAFESRKPNFSS